MPEQKSSAAAAQYASWGQIARREANYSDRIPAGVSQRWDPVIRSFLPPDLLWMLAKCRELNISEDSRLPPYGPPKHFDGLSSRPLRFLSIAGDGHCGFRSLSVMLTGSQDYFGIIRKRVAEFVVEHASEGWLSPHLPFPFHASSYLNRMLCTHGLVGRENYCTDVELMAAAVLFRMNILCYKADRGKWQLYAHNMSFDQSDDVPALLIELCYGHFTVVTDVEKLPLEKELIGYRYYTAVLKELSEQLPELAMRVFLVTKRFVHLKKELQIRTDRTVAELNEAKDEKVRAHADVLRNRSFAT